MSSTAYVIRLLSGSCDFNKDMCHYASPKVGFYWERKAGKTGYGRYKIPGDHSSTGGGITSDKYTMSYLPSLFIYSTKLGFDVFVLRHGLVSLQLLKVVFNDINLGDF